MVVTHNSSTQEKWQVQNSRKLNGATKKDPYPLPFTDEVLNMVVGYEAYSFVDGYSRYDQISITPKDKYKTPFVPE
jgi:hypothetical protein